MLIGRENVDKSVQKHLPNCVVETEFSSVLFLRRALTVQHHQRVTLRVTPTHSHHTCTHKNQSSYRKSLFNKKTPVTGEGRKPLMLLDMKAFSTQTRPFSDSWDQESFRRRPRLLLSPAGLNLSGSTPYLCITSSNSSMKSERCGNGGSSSGSWILLLSMSTWQIA